MASCARDGRAGFSLVEILVVLVVIAMMAAVAVPQFGASSNLAALDGAALKVRAAVLFAQGRSIGGVRHKVVFDASAETFEVWNVVANALAPDPENSTKNYRVVFTTEDGLQGVDLSATTFASSTVSFNDYGVPSAGGTVTLTRGGNTRTVTLDAFTGRVTIQ